MSCRLHVFVSLFLGWNGNGNAVHSSNTDPTPVLSALFNGNTSDSYGAPLKLHRGVNESELEFHLRETEQLLEISLLKKKLRETELAMSNIIAKMGTVPKSQVRFTHYCTIDL